MTPREAAEEIGCSTPHVRGLIRNGYLVARVRKLGTYKLRSGEIKPLFHYNIPTKEVERYKAKPIGRGRPRGPVK